MTAELGGRVRRQLATAAAGQAVLLAALAVGAGVGPAGLLAGTVHARRAVRPAGPARSADRASRLATRRRTTAGLGPANLVTLTRALLAGGVTALVVDRFATGHLHVGVLVVVAAVALMLDAVDGQVARRTRTVSALGARFDMETDAFLVLVLSAYVAPIVGPAALAIGGMRYAYAAASVPLPWLRAPLPTNRYSAKVVAATQGIVLVLTASGLVPPPPHPGSSPSPWACWSGPSAMTWSGCGGAELGSRRTCLRTWPRTSVSERDLPFPSRHPARNVSGPAPWC